MTYKLCVLIPTYNHHSKIQEIVNDLAARDIPVLVVDDGSNEFTQRVLETLSHAQVRRLPVNEGKGAAVESGLRWARDLGYTHVFQIDADGQHDRAHLEEFVLISKASPEALISGQPVYDSSMPLARKIGRWFTHFWVWVETLSFKITDSMCGYRIYPVDAAIACIDHAKIGKRMDFDTEIMVRMYWGGSPVLMHPVRVHYPEGNLSNFDVLKDNWRISKMHTRLVFSMLGQLPKIFLRKTSPQARTWAGLAERGSALGIAFLAACYRLLGRKICTWIASPVVLYFYLTGRTQRHASQDFLNQVYAVTGSSRRAGFFDTFRHFMNFFHTTLDKIAAWTGRARAEDMIFDRPEDVERIMESGQGGILLVSHLGNMEFCRPIARGRVRDQLHILLHHKNSQQFNKVLKRLNPQSNMNLIEVTDIGPDTIIYLRDKIQAGEWVVIAADRTPVKDLSRTVRVPFLGRDAAFSQGPYILASLLQCRVLTAMALKEGNAYKVFIEPFEEKIELPRKERSAAIMGYASKYASYLEGFATRYPNQWYNFFDFWK